MPKKFITRVVASFIFLTSVFLSATREYEALEREFKDSYALLRSMAVGTHLEGDEMFLIQAALEPLRSRCLDLAQRDPKMRRILNRVKFKNLGEE